MSETITREEHEKLATDLAKQAMRDLATANEKGRDGTSAQRMSAAVFHHHDASGSNVPLAAACTAKSSKAWIDLSKAMTDHFMRDDKKPTRGSDNDKRTDNEIATLTKAWNARRALIIRGLQLAAILAKHGYSLAAFDVKRGMWSVDPNMFRPDDCMAVDAGDRVALTQGVYLWLKNDRSGTVRSNLGVSQLISRYFPVDSATATGTQGSGARGRTDKVIKDYWVDIIDGAVKSLFDAKGKPTIMPTKFGSADLADHIPMATWNKVQKLRDLFQSWDRNLPKQAKPAPTPKGESKPFAMGQTA